jgi:hypothetical protein
MNTNVGIFLTLKWEKKEFPGGIYYTYFPSCLHAIDQQREAKEKYIKI